ncbi:MAG: ATP-binding protein, partial [Promicromonosporaceae bacterium]|nr:ATP-binding protein [Promicromonosporaceae bacterium]
RRTGLPNLPLDDFYFDHDHPGLPQRFGIVDWDSPETWNAAGAMEALVALCDTGEVEVPVYDIRTSSRVGSAWADLHGEHLVVAEGIFASELVDRLERVGLLADAICLVRPRLVSFTFRLARDLRERRKPVLTLIRRGIGLLRDERRQIAHWVAQGCHPMSKRAASARIAELAHS